MKSKINFDFDLFYMVYIVCIINQETAQVFS